MSEPAQDLFKSVVKNILLECGSLSEYELLIQLKQHSALEAILAQDDRDSSLSLFQNHFLLFHVLYQLQDELAIEHLGLLSISPVNIAITAYEHYDEAESGAVAEAGEAKLKAYYLDIRNLDNESEDSVHELLNKFWDSYIAKDRLSWALDVLGIGMNTEVLALDMKSVKQRYRQLAMAHHPDRGGDSGKLQEINEAYELMCRYLV